MKMKYSIRFGPAVFIGAILLLIILSSRADESVVTAVMVGHWEGNARIIVSWCHQKTFPSRWTSAQMEVSREKLAVPHSSRVIFASRF
jgi:hypothetical protein